jgi:dCTP deaminase
MSMTVLCDTQIRELIGIEPFEENVKRPGRVSFGVSSYGYDVRVGTRFKVFTNATTGGAAVVDPKQFNDDLFVTIDTDLTGRDHTSPRSSRSGGARSRSR